MLGQAAGAFVGGAAGGGIAKAMGPIIAPFKQFFAQVGEIFSAALYTYTRGSRRFL